MAAWQCYHIMHLKKTAKEIKEFSALWLAIMKCCLLYRSENSLDLFFSLV